MKKFSYTITDSQGIHARPAGLLVKTASSFSSDVTLNKQDKSGDAKRIFSVMSLGIKCGETVDVTVEGSDEVQAAEALQQFFEQNL